MVEYEFYKNSYKGKLSENEFLKQLPHAQKIFNSATFNRVDWGRDTPLDYNYCMCELADVCDASEKRGDVLSESDGVVSISYNSERTSRFHVGEIINKWLSGYYDITFRGI